MNNYTSYYYNQIFENKNNSNIYLTTIILWLISIGILDIALCKRTDYIISNIFISSDFIVLIYLYIINFNYNRIYKDIGHKILYYGIQFLLTSLLLNSLLFNKNDIFIGTYSIFLYILFIILGIKMMYLIEKMNMWFFHHFISIDKLFTSLRGEALVTETVKESITEKINIDLVLSENEIIPYIFKISSILAEKENEFNLKKYKFLLSNSKEKGYFHMSTSFIVKGGTRLFINLLLIVISNKLFGSFNLEIDAVSFENVKIFTLNIKTIMMIIKALLIFVLIIIMLMPVFNNYVHNKKIIKEKKILLILINEALDIKNN